MFVVVPPCTGDTCANRCALLVPCALLRRRWCRKWCRPSNRWRLRRSCRRQSPSPSWTPASSESCWQRSTARTATSTPSSQSKWPRCAGGGHTFLTWPQNLLTSCHLWEVRLWSQYLIRAKGEWGQGRQVIDKELCLRNTSPVCSSKNQCHCQLLFELKNAKKIWRLWLAKWMPKASQ